MKMLEKGNARARAIILLMASSDCRIGGLAGLKRRDLQVMPEFGGFKITVYADSPKDRYTTFCSPRPVEPQRRILWSGKLDEMDLVQ